MAAVPVSYSPQALQAACGHAAAMYSSVEDGIAYREYSYKLGGDSRVEVTFQRTRGQWGNPVAMHTGGDAGLLEKATDVMPCLNNIH